ncbi:YybH family protein [Chitinophaga sp. NPDC101104]|uniref:YybH family protein n=1 Tax=Chitinophaga sp. NPDC101104 TaxID=3390561 RepID=UPI003D0144A5
MDIGQSIKARETAVKESDVETAVAFYHPQVVMFDVVKDFQYQGTDALRLRLREWLGNLARVIDFEIQLIHLEQESALAWCATKNHVVAETLQGDKLDMWWRETVCYVKDTGKWLIRHVHSSVPFDPATGKASIDLKP